MSFMRCSGLGRHVRHGAGHLVEVALHAAAGAARPSAPRSAAWASGEVHSYSWRACTWPARSGGSRSSCHAPLGRHLLGDLRPALVAGLAGLLRQLVDAWPAPGRRRRAAAGRCPRRPRPGRAARASPGAAAAGARAAPASRPPARRCGHETPLQQALQGLVEVAVVEQLVGHLLEDVVGVEVEADLRAVPPRVLEPGHTARLRLGGGERRGKEPHRAGGPRPGAFWRACPKATPSTEPPLSTRRPSPANLCGSRRPRAVSSTAPPWSAAHR